MDILTQTKVKSVCLDPTRVRPLSQEEARRLIQAAGANGRIFKVRFIKRTTGDVRDLTCRLGVPPTDPKLKPGERKDEDARSATLTVYEMSGRFSGYKRIPLDAVLEVGIAG